MIVQEAEDIFLGPDTQHPSCHSPTSVSAIGESKSQQRSSF